MRSHPVALLTVASTLLSSATPPPPHLSRVVAAESPVRCRVTEPRDSAASNIVVTGSTVRRGRRLSTYDLAAPPPPPSSPPPAPMVMAPPPPMMAPMAPPSIVAAPTVSRAGAYGSRENTERYDGRAVAAIQDVATAPVSTFSVDVDTGAYANVRRFRWVQRVLATRHSRGEKGSER